MKGKILGKLLAFTLCLATVWGTIVCTSEDLSAAKVFTYGTVAPQQVGVIKTIFNAREYSALYPDLKDAGVTTDEQLWAHFINCGIWEHRQPCAAIQIDCYASSNGDLHKAFGSDIPSYYVYYATHLKEQTWRSVPTFAGQGRQGNTVYSVEDFVVGQDAPKAGAIPVQTLNSWLAYVKDNPDAQ